MSCSPVCPALLILSLFAQRVELFIHSFMLQLALMSWWTWAALRGTFRFPSQSAQYEWEWLRDCFSWLYFRSIQDSHNLRECIIDVSHTHTTWQLEYMFNMAYIQHSCMLVLIQGWVYIERSIYIRTSQLTFIILSVSYHQRGCYLQEHYMFLF